MDQQTRERKEAFVSGSGGSSLWTINAAFLGTVLLSHMLRRSLRISRGSLMLEFLAIVLPITVACTDWGVQQSHMLQTILLLSFCCSYYYFRKAPASRQREAPPKAWVFVTEYRAYLQLITVASILAVDFTIFPRYFVKTETYGTALMDLGVGCFVFSGIPRSDAKARGSRIVNSLKTCAILLVIGIGRVLSTKSLNYQEHASEYGVHWNFFLTLSALTLTNTLLAHILSPKLYIPFAAFVLFAYEYSLNNLGLESYILNAERVDFLSMNKEGVFSCLGYISIFYFASGIANIVFSAPSSGGKKKSTQKNDIMAILSRLSIAFLCFLAVASALDFQSYKISRRMANAGYVVWIVCTNLALLLFFAFVDALFKDTAGQACLMLEKINRNQLFVFMAGNLMTGAVNFSMDTLNATWATAFAVLNSYMLVLCLIAFFV